MRQFKKATIVSVRPLASATVAGKQTSRDYMTITPTLFINF